MNTTINVQDLSNDELLSVWKRVGLDVPANLVTETVRRGDALVPQLGAMLVEADLWAAPDEGGWAPIHAIFLLSAIASPAAAPYVAEFLRRDFGESWTTEEGQFLVFSLGPQGAEPVLALLDDDSADEWGRVVAVEGLSLIAMSDEVSRPRIIERFRSKAAELVGKPENSFTGKDMTVLTRLCDELGALHDEQSRDLIRRAFAEGRCDEFFTEFDHTDDSYQIPFDESLRLGRQDPLQHFDPAELDRLRMISEGSRREDSDKELEGDFEFELPEKAIPITAAPKVGRNDPCPCGSGKKHKRCCLRGE